MGKRCRVELEMPIDAKCREFETFLKQGQLFQHLWKLHLVPYAQQQALDTAIGAMLATYLHGTLTLILQPGHRHSLTPGRKK